MFTSKLIAFLLAISVIYGAVVEPISSNTAGGALEVRSLPTRPLGDLILISDVGLQADGDNVAAFATLSGTAVALTGAVCTAIASTGPLGVAGCILQGLVVTIGVFFSFFALIGKRDLDFDHMLDYPAAPGCHAACQLDTYALEGDWRVVGNASVSGVHHDLYYRRNGTLSSVRSVQRGITTDIERRAEWGKGGMVVDYHWDNNKVSDYDAFGSTHSQIKRDATFFEQEMVQSNSALGCAGWQHHADLVANGLIAIGWNNRAFQFAEGEENALVNMCGARLA
ncbi:hypothetical protein NQ176_g3340 [Zarea fungicola]|uniref:Uncharacterized protein n=1 Tax=Zarea fungicola TaxID=93591 RepID=A0ACC1NLA5_9HYPO|nr:hypothetical protein NQ176_g3340 [Lecanicillium fungicola]